jgi:predicted RNase H-like nuclease (RuvC/YqgF family)
MTEKKREEFEAASAAYEESRAISEKAEAFRQDVFALAKEKSRLISQIEQLEKRCRTEKQTRRRYELHQEIVKLRKELEG